MGTLRPLVLIASLMGIAFLLVERFAGALFQADFARTLTRAESGRPESVDLRQEPTTGN